MTRYREALPQLGPVLFLTDSGLETELIYNQDVDLPQFAAFPLLDNPAGVRRLRNYFADHAAIAARADVGFVLESATWRANADWGALLGYNADALDRVNRKAIDLLVEVRAECAQIRRPSPISGCVGPRDDGYAPGSADDRGGGARLPPAPDHHVRRHPSRPDHRDDPDLPRRGDRYRPGRTGRGDAGGAVVHGGDRWKAA